MNNLSEYFKNEQEFYLDSISYERVNHSIVQQEVQLLCRDMIQTRIIDGDTLNVLVTREIKFDPEVLFKLIITYGCTLHFVPEKKDEVDWEKTDLSEAFKKQGAFATGNLFNRISLLIGEITSSFGQSPIIVPPQPIATNE